MESDRIEKLLEKYFEADTTMAEEKDLRTYFSDKEVAPHLKQYAPMFAHFSNAKEEKFTKRFPLNGKSVRPKRNLYKWVSVAAVVVVMLVVYFGKSYQDEQKLQRQQAEYAYNQTKMALDLLAENFSRGTEKVAYLNEFVEAKQKIYNKN
jgi:hypothetical protein